MNIQIFAFGPFQENTYLLWDDTREAVIIDPGNYTHQENQILERFITDHQLSLTRLLLTHAHIDHISGNDFIFTKYKLYPEVHEDDLFLIETQELTCKMYGLACTPSPLPILFLKENDIIRFGKSELQCIHTPGHSPGSISFYSKKDNILISGDVLFYESIGRTDLPKGNFETLINSIKDKLYQLPAETTVYSGHGQSTTIAHEIQHNPFTQ